MRPFFVGAGRRFSPLFADFCKNRKCNSFSAPTRRRGCTPFLATSWPSAFPRQFPLRLLQRKERGCLFGGAREPSLPPLQTSIAMSIEYGPMAKCHQCSIRWRAVLAGRSAHLAGAPAANVHPRVGAPCCCAPPLCLYSSSQTFPSITNSELRRHRTFW